MKLEKAIRKISEISKDKKTVFVAIDGRSGSGKTSVAKEIASKLNNVELIHLDAFDMYRGKSSSEAVINQIIESNLKKSERRTVILEGIFSLNNLLLPYYDYRIWVDCPREVGFERGLKRDIELNGIDNSEKWKTYWLPKEDKYIKDEQPEKKADVVIDGAGNI